MSFISSQPQKTPKGAGLPHFLEYRHFYSNCNGLSSHGHDHRTSLAPQGDPALIGSASSPAKILELCLVNEPLVPKIKPQVGGVRHASGT